jgi:GNAT superfamily N-acetyltransferase
MSAQPEFQLPPGCKLYFQPAPEFMTQVYTLRVQAWRARTQAFPDMDEWRDDYDDVALHWAIVTQTTAGVPLAVAAARMTIHAQLSEVPSAEIYDGLLPVDLPGPIASINRLVVAKHFAGQGLSQILDAARIAYARSQECHCVVVETFAGMRRHDELLRQGFVALGQARPHRDGPLAVVKDCRGGRSVTSFGFDVGRDAFIFRLR